jgi:DNA-binding response OmpR family regulator
MHIFPGTMRILLVEDERKVARFVARALEENRFKVEVADSGDRALEIAAQMTFDAILLDLRLPTIDGLQVCRELRATGVETPILMLTARSLIEHRVEGLDAGADDYLTKPFAVAELLARVRALTRRGLHNRSAVLHCGNLQLDRQRRHVTRAGTQVALTSKEFSLLELLLLKAPQPVTRSEIIEHVWSYGFDTETNLVEVYINRLRQKIDQDHREKLIQTVRGVGYQLGAA